MLKAVDMPENLSVELEPLENSAWKGLSNTYKIVYAYIMSDLRQYGLTPPQYAVLSAIGKSRSRQLSMSEIGNVMIVTYANITTIVDNLEKRKYVVRVKDLSDRRLVRVKLTGSGSKLFARIYTAHRKEVARLMMVLGKNELRNLLDYTSKIAASVSKNSRLKK
jgi:MarR family 2-MHQ and catechol resistance regulon transcriptional repressor